MGSTDGTTSPADATREIELTDAALSEEHERLVQRDFVIGLQAQVDSLKTRVRLLRMRNRTLRSRLDAARSAPSSTLLSRVAATVRRGRRQR